MNAFSLGELATAITICCASLGGLLAVCMRSRCDEVKCCFGLLQLHRQIPAVPEVEDAAPAADQIV